jgi:glucose/arabinose dehydrogenase
MAEQNQGTSRKDRRHQNISLTRIDSFPFVRPNLNHGLAVTSTHLYASESTAVYRWPYDADIMNVTGAMEIVIDNINADGRGGAPFGHTTRTLAITQDEMTLYVSVGSDDNIDPDSFRSRIRRFSLADASLFPLNFIEGEVFVDGLRNEVGITFDARGILWGVGNSADKLVRDDLGGDIHNDNPAEELHKHVAGQNYGYPYCWREYGPLALGLGRGTTWAWPTTMDVVSDEECRTEYDTPIFTMPAHSAPLGIEFYQYPDVLCDGVWPFPREMDGYAFVTYHGSWNRDIPTGYKVVYMPVDATGQVVGEAVDLLSHNGTGAKWSSGVRPVDVSFDECGRLLVTSDGTETEDSTYFGDMVIRIETNIPPRDFIPIIPIPSVVSIPIPSVVSMATPLATTAATTVTTPTAAPIEASASSSSASAPISAPASGSCRVGIGGLIQLFVFAYILYFGKGSS